MALSLRRMVSLTHTRIIMKALLSSLTLGASVLFSGFAFGALENCVKPTTSGDWSSYCSCFLEQALKACNSCSVTVCRPATEEAVKFNILNRTPDSTISTLCNRQNDQEIKNEADNNPYTCLAPGVDANSCASNIRDFKEHCA